MAEPVEAPSVRPAHRKRPFDRLRELSFFYYENGIISWCKTNNVNLITLPFKKGDSPEGMPLAGVVKKDKTVYYYNFISFDTPLLPLDRGKLFYFSARFFCIIYRLPCRSAILQYIISMFIVSYAFLRMPYLIKTTTVNLHYKAKRHGVTAFAKMFNKWLQLVQLRGTFKKTYPFKLLSCYFSNIAFFTCENFWVEFTPLAIRFIK